VKRLLRGQNSFFFSLADLLFIQDKLKWSAGDVSVMVAIHENLGNGRMHEMLPSGSLTRPILHFVLGDSALELKQQAIKDFTGYPVSTISRTLNGDFDPSWLEFKYPFNVTHDRVNEEKEEYAHDYIEDNAKMKSHPPVRIMRSTFKNFFKGY
jgi:hypothetical protein